MATTTANNVVQAEMREAKGKNHARRVRKGGRVPATVYGAGKPPISISVDPKQIGLILHSATGHNTIIDLQMASDSTKTMIVDWQRDPIKGALLHLDLKRIAMDKMLTVKVPILLIGESVGVKLDGGIMEQVLREIELECLPDDIPAKLEIDITHLVSGQVLRVKDLPHGGTLHFLTDEESPVAHIVHVKEVVEAAAADATVDAAAGTPAEPEVIKKGKQEAEEGADKGKADKGKEKK